MREDYPKLAAYFAERARGGVGLMVTGGIAPNAAGWTKPFAGTLSGRRHVARHRLVTDAVHAAGGRICMQILHTGRYAYHPLAVAPVATQGADLAASRRANSRSAASNARYRAFVRCAALAQEAGYDGVEIMGSEGYFINQFLVARTNRRADRWGGSWPNRMRLPLEIVARTRAAVGREFIIIYRLSMLDLVEGGSTLGRRSSSSPRRSSAQAPRSSIPASAGTRRASRLSRRWCRARLSPGSRAGCAARSAIPLVTSNRINDPAVAERVLADGDADLVSMARPLLADPDFVVRRRAGARTRSIPASPATRPASISSSRMKSRLAS